MLEVGAADEITALLGRGKVLTDEEVLEKYSTDMGGFRRRPSAVVVAENVEDVSRLLKFCNERKIPVTAWGAGSSLTGAVVSDSIILDLSKLDRILRIDTVNYYVHVEAGVVLERLNRELEKHGFFFPPDPASSFICTVGGVVAEGSGGLRCVKYGTVKDWVLALKVVLADGSVAVFGEPLPKNRAGYNLVQLLVGSEGTLGIIVEAWLKIAPIPDVSIKRVYAVFDSWADAGNAILEIRRRRIVPRMLEFFDSVGLEAANRMHGENLPIGEAMLLIDVEEYRGNETSNLLSILKRNNARTVKIAESEEEAEKLLQIRATMYMALNAISKARVIEDVCVPIDRIVDYLTKVKEISKKYGVVVSMNGHAGDGNIHPSVLYDPDNPDEVKHVEKVVQELIRYSTEIGGTITGEHGVGLQKMRDLAMQLESHNGPQVLELMRRLKKLFDPNNILNPGKYVDMT
ncbi:MAG: FAD-binding protein [Candidatus Caldarchaeum sp.]|nr:FAD-binding protein [Candidatus Caldarchaeum sp.]MDW7978902.1 FAD-linked oxidase C-terminal domain-containing protein [Candidatus Caldarchaeum sp.]